MDGCLTLIKTFLNSACRNATDELCAINGID